MSGSLDHSQADIVRFLLVDIGAGTLPGTSPVSWPVYSYVMPNAPDSCICTFDSQGKKDGRTQIDGEVQEHHGCEIMVRSGNGKVGRAKARAIADAIDKEVRMSTVSIESSSYVVHSISRTSDVLSIGKEPNSERSLFTVNCVVSVRQVS